MSTTFKIYTKSKKFTITENVIVYGCIAIGALGFWIFKALNFETLKSLFQGIIVTSIIVGLYFKLTQHFRYERLGGKLDGEITFDYDKITVNDKKIKLEEIKKINLEISDYEGAYSVPVRGDFDAALSNGVNNNVNIQLNTNEKLNYKIKVFKGQEHFLKEQLIRYMNEGKISAYRVTDILGIKKYHDIQDFKKKYYRQHVV